MSRPTAISVDDRGGRPARRRQPDRARRARGRARLLARLLRPQPMHGATVASGDRLAFRAVAGAAARLSSGFDGSAIALYDVAAAAGAAPGLRREHRAAVRRQLGPRRHGPGARALPGELRAGARAGHACGAAPGPTCRQPAGRRRRVPDRARRASCVGEAQRLADHRQRQGLAARVVDLDVVMDVFDHGRRDPPASASFLATRSLNWPVRPRVSWCSRARAPTTSETSSGSGSDRVPTTLVSTPAGLAPADAPLADVDGDGIAEVAVGRIPAITAEEFAAYVDKVEAFESAPGGDWQSSALMIADDADTAGNFAQTSEALTPAPRPRSRSTGSISGRVGGVDLAGQRARLRGELATGTAWSTTSATEVSTAWPRRAPGFERRGGARQRRAAAGDDHADLSGGAVRLPLGELAGRGARAPGGRRRDRALRAHLAVAQRCRRELSVPSPVASSPAAKTHASATASCAGLRAFAAAGGDRGPGPALRAAGRPGAPRSFRIEVSRST